MPNRLLVIGLDCAPPELVFERYRDRLPNPSSLLADSLYARLESTVPPITVPAWASMFSGKDPGTLGIYGLRNRTDYTYNSMAIANADWVKEPSVWDLLGAAGHRSILVGVPQTYPLRPINGVAISSFLTPGPESTYTYPDSLKAEVETVAAPYLIDVPDFRTDQKDRVLADIREMTTKRFRVTRHLIETREWEFAVHVEMGTDRINHAFWRYADPSHRDYTPDSPYRDAIFDYYRLIDDEIGRTLDLVGPETDIMLVSDHGAKAIDGGFAINDWLIEEGYLNLLEPPGKIENWNLNNVDWSRTRVWGEGGYYARLCLNIENREPTGIVREREADALLDEISSKLSQLERPDGMSMQNTAHRPERIYQNVNGIAPDLIVYLDDLRYRSVASVGHENVFVAENDTGQDDANHAQFGVFSLRSDRIEPGPADHLDIRDVASTILSLFGIAPPDDFQGRSILEPGRSTVGIPDSSRPSAGVYTDEEQAAVEKRLRALGYL